MDGQPSGNDSAGIGIWVNIPGPYGNRHRGWSITNNKVERMMGPGIMSTVLVDALTIADNVVINCALAPMLAILQVWDHHPVRWCRLHCLSQSDR